MTAGTTIRVPHLGGIDAGYRLSNGAVDPAKPTVVLVNSMCMTSALYDIQFGNKALTDVANLLAIEPLGHGATETKAENYTYWDTAIMAVQVLDALNIKKAFALGTSQGGWIVTRMALVAPEKVCKNSLRQGNCRIYNMERIHPCPVSPFLLLPTAWLPTRMSHLHSPNSHVSYTTASNSSVLSCKQS